MKKLPLLLAAIAVFAGLPGCAKLSVTVPQAGEEVRSSEAPAASSANGATNAGFDTSVLSDFATNFDALTHGLHALAVSEEGLSNSFATSSEVVATNEVRTAAALDNLSSSLNNLTNRLRGLALSQEGLSNSLTISAGMLASNIANAASALTDSATNFALIAKNSSVSPSDLLRVLWIPVVLWICQCLIRYALGRFNLIKTLQIDIQHRLANAVTACLKLEEWRKALDAVDFAKKVTPADWPLLKRSAEDHILYKNVQSDMVECLWGKEIQLVREIYRYLENTEDRLRRIQALNERIVTIIADNGCAYIPPKPPCLAAIGPTLSEEIEHHLHKYRKALDAVLNGSTVMAKAAEQFGEVRKKAPSEQAAAQGLAQAKKAAVAARAAAAKPTDEAGALAKAEAVAQAEAGEEEACEAAAVVDDWQYDDSKGDEHPLLKQMSKFFIPLSVAYGTQLLGPLLGRIFALSTLFGSAGGFLAFRTHRRWFWPSGGPLERP